MQNSMMLFSFFVFKWKCPFRANLAQKVKIISWIWNLVARLIQICRIQWCCSLFCFWVEIPFLGKFGPKNQNCHFKLKFRTYTKWNMQNSVVMFIYFVFDWKYPFSTNLVQKIKIISWSLNLVARLIWICRIQWCYSLFCFLTEAAFLGKFGPNWQYLQFFLFPIRNALFWENLVQNVKVVSLRLNLLVTIFCKIYLEFSRFH